jgi:hypothetical protein
MSLFCALVEGLTECNNRVLNEAASRGRSIYYYCKRYRLPSNSGLLGRPRLAGCEIGVTRFTHRPAMLKAPLLNLS